MVFFVALITFFLYGAYISNIPSYITLSSCKKYLHPFGKADSGHVTYVLGLILGVCFVRIASVNKLLVLHMVNSF